MSDNPHNTIDEDAHRRCAVALFNYTWTLLDKTGRTPDEDDEMIRAAYASRWHWGVVGTPLNQARGEWLVARCCAESGSPEGALHHAKIYLEDCTSEEFEVFDLAFAHEGMARSLLCARELSKAQVHVAEAEQLGEQIEKESDRDWLRENLNELKAALSCS